MTSARTRSGGLAVACALAAAVLSGCTPPPSGPAVVVLFPGSEDDVWGASAEALRGELAGDGFAVEVRFAGDDIPVQLGQLREALAAAPDAEPAAVVIAPVDATAIAAELADADDPDVAVISYDRLILDSPAVDYYATFDHRAAGRLQAQALLDGLDGLRGDDPEETADPGPRAVELLAGSGDDPAAQAAFEGALEVLRPAIDAGALVVPSGRTDLEQAAILRGRPATAASRVAKLLDDGVDLAGVLSPSDAMSTAIREALTDAGRGVALPGRDPVTAPQPTSTTAPPAPLDGAAPGIIEVPRVVLTGGGSTRAGLEAVAAGWQSSTVYEDPRELARLVASMVREVVRGTTPTVTQGVTSDNGAREVPTRLLEPRLVATRADALALLR